VQVYAFDVGLSTHALLRQGVTTAVWSRVTVAADSDGDAHVAAAQLAHAVHGEMMVTSVLWRL